MGNIIVIDIISIGLLDNIYLIVRIIRRMGNEEVDGLVSRLKNGRKTAF